jgi:hypothetical protein
MRRWLGCILAVCAAGCSSVGAADDDALLAKTLSARLHIEHTGTSQPVTVSLVTGPLKGCQPGDRTVLASLGGMRDSQSVAIPAQGAAILNISSASPTAKCEFRAKFMPEPGAQYRLTYRTVQGGCILSLEKRDGGGWKAEPYDDPNPECQPKPAGAK